MGVNPSSALDHRLDAVGRQYLERRALGRGGDGVGVLTHEKRAADPLAGPVVTDRLGDGQDMGLGEGALLGSTAMAAGAEMDQLLRVALVRPALVILDSRACRRRSVAQPGPVDRRAGIGSWRLSLSLHLGLSKIIPRQLGEVISDSC